MLTQCIDQSGYLRILFLNFSLLSCSRALTAAVAYGFSLLSEPSYFMWLNLTEFACCDGNISYAHERREEKKERRREKRACLCSFASLNCFSFNCVVLPSEALGTKRDDKKKSVGHTEVICKWWWTGWRLCMGTEQWMIKSKSISNVIQFVLVTLQSFIRVQTCRLYMFTDQVFER